MNRKGLYDTTYLLLLLFLLTPHQALQLLQLHLRLHGFGAHHFVFLLHLHKRATIVATAETEPKPPTCLLPAHQSSLLQRLCALLCFIAIPSPFGGLRRFCICRCLPPSVSALGPGTSDTLPCLCQFSFPRRYRTPTPLIDPAPPPHPGPHLGAGGGGHN